MMDLKFDLCYYCIPIKVALLDVSKGNLKRPPNAIAVFVRDSSITNSTVKL